MTIGLLAEVLEPWRSLAEYEAAHPELRGPAGASAVFVGHMRDSNAGAAVSRMHLEHYPGMSERELERIVAEAAGRWELLDTLVLHRVGELVPGDPIVLVAVWSAHRKAAFEACRAIMEALKSRVPFWKKEQGEAGGQWVERNTPGY